MASKGRQGYFRVSSVTLETIAKLGKPELLIGFLVLARFSNGAPPQGIAPHTISCGGANAMKQYAGLSEATSKGVIDALLEAGFLMRATDADKAAFAGARFRPTYRLCQEAIDLDLPHAFVDGLAGYETSSPLRRLREAGVRSECAESLSQLSKADCQLDALTLLLSIYKNTEMVAYGGLHPRSTFRKWETKSKRRRDEGGFEWMAEPEDDRAYTDFMRQSLPHVPVAGKSKGQLSDLHKGRFWNAWAHIKDRGLIYEAVAMFDVDPGENANARLICTLRVNDFHADSARKARNGTKVDVSNDPSLLKAMLNVDERTLHFYTHPAYPYDSNGQSRSDPESLRLTWPDKSGHLIGIWRPRFRAINADAGSWVDVENEGIAGMAQRISTLGT